MSEQRGFCHACHQGFVLIDNDLVASASEQEPSCPLCGSEFVELTSSGPPTSASLSGAGQPPLGMSVYAHPGATVAVRVSNLGDSSLSEVLESLLPRFGEFSGRLRTGDFSFGNAFDRIIDQLAESHEPVRTPADPGVVAGLRRRRLTESEVKSSSGVCVDVKEGDRCAVCHEDYCVGDQVMDLPCDHHFHESCITPWLREHNTCPVCRLALPAQEGGEVATTPTTTMNARLAVVGGGDHNARDVRERDTQTVGGGEGSAAAAALQLAHVGVGGRTEGGGSMMDSMEMEGVVVGSEEEEGGLSQESSSPNRGVTSDFQSRIQGAESELEALQRRLAVQLSEHERLQGQIQDLQTRRSQLQSQFQHQSRTRLRLRIDEAAERAEALAEAQHARADSILSRLTYRIRQVLGRAEEAGGATRNSIGLGNPPPNNDSEGGHDGV